jgi:hypothetical protein
VILLLLLCVLWFRLWSALRSIFSVSVLLPAHKVCWFPALGFARIYPFSRRPSERRSGLIFHQRVQCCPRTVHAARICFFPSIALCVCCLPFSPACLIFRSLVVAAGQILWLLSPVSRAALIFPALHFLVRAQSHALREYPVGFGACV